MAKDCWELVESVVGNSRRVLLYGPPGTGKTYAAVKANTPTAYSKSAGKEIDNVYQITMTEDTASANLEGFYRPSSTGAFEWHDGIAIQSWKNGGRLIINEIDHASPDAMTFLHAILDDQDIAMLTLNNDKKETVRPSQGFQVVATTNSPPESLPLALKDRFPVKIHVDTIHPDAMKDFPTKWHEVITDTSLVEDAEDRVSIRSWREFFDLQEKGFDEQTAATLVFSDKADELLDAITLAAADAE